jgi:hypothetical protein
MSFSTGNAAPPVFLAATGKRGARADPATRRLANAFRLVPVVCWLSLLFPLVAQAAITIESKVGYRGVFQLGRPFPIGVTLANSGPPADGILEIQIWKGGAAQGGAPYAALHRRELFLPARSQRTVQFAIDPDFLSRPLRIQFSTPSGSVAQELDLRRHFSPAPVILLISEGNSIPLTPPGASPAHRVVALTLPELPAEPRALLGVSHLVLYDQSLRELSRAQSLALDDWLAAGGKMVIIGSLNFTLYQEPQLARYLPVRVTGAKRIVFVPDAGPSGPPAIRDVWAQTATLLKGTAIMESQGLPLLVENEWGKGRVIYLALDAGRPPLTSWNGLAQFLQRLLAPAVGDGGAKRPQWNEAIFSQLLLSPSFISAYIPTGSLFIAITGYLGGVFALSWLWQRRRMRPRTLALSGFGWVFFSAVAGYLYFSRGGQVPDGVLVAATVMENAGDGYVEAQTNLALFSTQPREYALAFGRGWMDLMPLMPPAYAQSTQTLVYRYGGGTTRVELPVKEWGYRLLRARYVERLALRATVESQQNRLRLDVRNQSGRDLVDCWLLAPGARIPLGDLPKGESWSKTFPFGGPASGSNTEQNRGRGADELNFREITFNDKTRDILFHSSFFPRDGAEAPWRGSAAVFFGWIRDPERRVEIGDARIRVHNYALYRMIVPLPGAEEE